jgi:hypothetical protein
LLVGCRRRMRLPHAGSDLEKLCREWGTSTTCPPPALGLSMAIFIPLIAHTPPMILCPQGTCLTEPVLCYEGGFCLDTVNEIETDPQGSSLGDCLYKCYDAGYNYCDYDDTSKECYGGATCGGIYPLEDPTNTWATYALNGATCSPA